MKTLCIALITAIAVGFVIAAATVAQTPAGNTRVEEGVCESLRGVNTGLYGQYPDSVVDPGALKSVPKPIIFANYDKKMRAGDSAVPCVKAPCLCSDKSDFDLGLPKPVRIQRVDSHSGTHPLRIVST